MLQQGGTVNHWFSIFKIIGFAVLGGYLYFRFKPQFDRGEALLSRFIIPINIIVLFLLTISTIPQISSTIPRIGNTKYPEFIHHHLNQTDMNRQFKGYYEDLQYHNNFFSVLWQLEKQKNTGGVPYKIDVFYQKSPLFFELYPNLDTLYKYTSFTTNKWGMRDLEYSKIPPKNTVRIAVIGSSNELGGGVLDDKVFEQIVEQKLNKHHGKGTLKFEVLNFAYPNASFILHQETIRKKVLDFQPSILLFCIHKPDKKRIYQNLKKDLLDSPRYKLNPEIFRDSIPWFSQFEQFLASKNIKNLHYVSERDQKKYGEEILRWSFANLEQLTKKANTQNFMVYVPSVSALDSDFYPYCSMTSGTSFRCIDLANCFKLIEDKSSLMLNAWDDHPNQQAHQLIGNLLYNELVSELQLNCKKPKKRPVIRYNSKGERIYSK